MRHLIHSAIAAAAIALAAPGAAGADTTNSANWAGYAAHRPGVSFNRVYGSWTQPRATCSPPHRTFSAIWVGLGGFSIRSTALEQIGTEVDCTASGRVVSSAWYELVPERAHMIALNVRPGDSLVASVTVSGRHVTLVIRDTTTRRSFRKMLRAQVLDVSSADWIVEAPSSCYSATDCQTLPLANFGSVALTSATATSSSGHRGTISDLGWGSTKINLTPGGRRFVAYTGSGLSAGAALPSPLSATGSAFTVTYSNGSVQGAFGPSRTPASPLVVGARR